MKKFLKSFLFAALGIFALSSCEDVPAPYTIPGTEGSGETKKVETTGDGTFANPYTAADALALITKNAIPEGKVYVKGIISAIGVEKDGSLEDLPGNSFGNATYFISDDGTTDNQFEIFRGKGLGGADFTSADDLKIGDQVIVYGTLTLFHSTPEMTSGSILVKLNDQVIEPTELGDPEGEGTAESPYNVAAALGVCESLQKSSTSASYLSDEVYVKGKVSKIEGEIKNGALTYCISEDGNAANELKVYQGKYLNGNDFFSKDLIKEGNEVVVFGKLQNWLGTFEFTGGSKLISIDGNTTPEEPKPITGENLLINGDFETWTEGQPDNWKSTSTAGNATLSQSEDARGGSYAVAIAANASSNKRMAYKELTLKAGTYKFSIYAKSTTEDKSQTEVGYVTVNNGTADSQGYKYGGYVSLNNTEWTEVSTTFTLSAQTTICLVVMNPKTTDYATAQTILVDDATLITSDGGISEGDDTPDDNPDTPDPSTSTFDQDFTKGIGGWTIQNVEIGSLNYVWQQTAQYGMKASAYVNKTNNAAEAWLISPALAVEEKKTINISNCLNFLNSGTLSDFVSVMVSTDYNEGLPATATWTALDFAPLPDGKSYTWVDSKTDISAYANKTIHIAFKYVSTTAIAPTWEIKTVSVE